MWERLDTPDIVVRYMREARPSEAELLASFLRGAQTRSWAHSVSAATSLGALRLTSQLAYEDNVAVGSIHLRVTESEQIALSYVPPHSESSATTLVRDPGEGIAALETMLPRLFEDHGRRSPEGTSADGDRENPWFELGVRVQVVPNGRNRTLRAGVVANRIWHHKHECWTYFIESDGKRVSKRYVAEDLEPVGEPR